MPLQFQPILSQSHDLSLDEVCARLAGKDVVEAVLTFGSTGTAALNPNSDYDLLVVLSEMPVPLHVLLTTVDGRLTDVLFADSSLITQIVNGQYEGPSTEYEGALVERLKTGELIYDRDGRIGQARQFLADREWLVKPDLRDIYERAVHGIHYNYQHNKRYLAYGELEYDLALEFRMHYCLAQILFGYFTVRRIPWQGEKSAVQYWQTYDPGYLALFEKYHATANLEERFAIYAEMAGRTLEPVGGLWPDRAVNVVLEGDDWREGDITRAVDFWHSLVA